MKNSFTIKINFTGGIISPGDLLYILTAAAMVNVQQVSFGLRQQLFLEVVNEDCNKLITALKSKQIAYEIDTDNHPNIVSSYPAEEIFISKTWLSEGVYKDIFDAFDYIPKLKVNISDSKQSFTPLLTGNINWVASNNQHFWHLFIRFPKTNFIYPWPDVVYTNDIAAITKNIESVILSDPIKFYDNKNANGFLLFITVMQQRSYIVKSAEDQVVLPAFMLPYYEGFNKVNNKYWLGIYRRDEKFSVKFLQEVCSICLATKVGQLCSTPWKSIIIKGIEEKDRSLWDTVLGKHQINVRHAANELNFQVEDDCADGLILKNYLVNHLQQKDVRSFGICIGIKTRRKSEVFSSILINRIPLFKIAGICLLYRYDILCAKDFNPNERTGFTFSRTFFRNLLPEQLRKAIISFYNHKEKKQQIINSIKPKNENLLKEEKVEIIHQCSGCLSVYDVNIGEPDNNIIAGTKFEDLPDLFCCYLCGNERQNFVEIKKSSLFILDK